MLKQGKPEAGSSMRIRVFYPNPIGTIPGIVGPTQINAISKEYEVFYLEVLDPIYHELVFIDKEGTRHRIIGLAYHLTETLPSAGGIDGSA